MTPHAIAMVKWKVFRPGAGSELFTRSYYYASRQRRLVNLVGDGGTLWLVTSRRKRGEPRRYHLAYKLVDCVAAPPSEEIAEQFGPYMVHARDWDRSVHFPYNEVTETLLRLRFTSGQPVTDRSKIGLRLLSIPQLTPEDMDLVERFQQKVFSERTAFLSYAHRNRRVATRLERELEARNVHVWRDETSLRAGEVWQAALARIARSADCVLVLISPAAAASDWVRREVNWATTEFAAGGLVERIIPLLLPSGGWDGFPELQAFQRVDYPRQPDAAFFDRLAAEIASVPAGELTMDSEAYEVSVLAARPEAPRHWKIEEYPRPQRDNGRGIHWFPTLSQSREVVDRFVPKLRQMRIRWVLIMNGLDRQSRFANDYLVSKLVGPDRSKPQIMPIMRIFTTVTEPMNLGILRDVVAHYVHLGVSYFQLYNEPNLNNEWGAGRVPTNPAKKFLDIWIPAAETVLAAGGLPSIPPLAPYGNYDDMKLLREIFEEINRRGRQDLYRKLWVCIHNYTLGRHLDYNDDSRGFRMFLHYNKIIKRLVGHPLPQLSGEAGLRLGLPPYGDTMDESFVSQQTVEAYQRVVKRSPDFYFCFTAWLIGNEIGGGHDPRWESVAWFKKDGTQQMVVDAVKAMPDQIRSLE
jgi:hypothetical protein